MTRRTARLALAVIGSLGLAYGAWFGWSAALHMPCENHVLREVDAPAGGYRAVVFERSCGATTAFSTQVSILPADQNLGGGPGNVLIADTDHGRAPAGPGGGPEVRLSWLGPTQLSVSRHEHARVFLAEPAVGDVRVEHSQFRE